MPCWTSGPYRGSAITPVWACPRLHSSQALRENKNDPEFRGHKPFHLTNVIPYGDSGHRFFRRLSSRAPGHSFTKAAGLHLRQKVLSVQGPAVRAQARPTSVYQTCVGIGCIPQDAGHQGALLSGRLARSSKQPRPLKIAPGL